MRQCIQVNNIMSNNKRQEQIREASIETKIQDLSKQVIYGLGFIEGANWSDEHPDKNNVYTKQELIDMGFGFDLNGNIVTLEEYNEMVKRGHEHIKNKLIEKACEWLKKTMYIHTEHDTDVDWGTTKPIDWVTSDYDTVDEFIEAFKKNLTDETN